MKNVYDKSEEDFILGFDTEETALLDSALDWDKDRRPMNYMGSDELVENQAFNVMEDLKRILDNPSKKTLSFHASDRIVDTLTDILYTYSNSDEARDLEYHDLAITMAAELLSTQVDVELLSENLALPDPESSRAVDENKFLPQEIDRIVDQTKIPDDPSSLNS